MSSSGSSFPSIPSRIALENPPEIPLEIYSESLRFLQDFFSENSAEIPEDIPLKLNKFF